MSNLFSQQWGHDWTELALANSGEPIMWLSSEARIVRFNQALAKMLNYEPDTLMSFTLFDMDEQLTKRDWKKYWEQITRQKSFLLESHLQTQENSTIPVELSFALIETDQLDLCFVFVKDISKRIESRTKLEEANLLLEMIVKEREESSKMTIEALKARQLTAHTLEKLERRNQLILDSAGVGIYGLDTQGHTTFANNAAAEMVGWELEELEGKSQHALLHHTKPDGTAYDARECPIYAAFKDGEVHRVDDEVFWRKDGTCFPVEYTSTPIKDADGNLQGAVVIFNDITERKKNEEAIKRVNQELQNALQEVANLKKQLELENKYLQQEIKLTHNFEEIISQSAVFKKVLQQIEQVAPTDANVLILGESGTGKELLARAVHSLSKRNGRPLVKVNCAALPANLIESELFGHEKGAFTGAFNKKIGRFELADGGTIFLDEVGEIPIELQPKLLRVLQEGEFERLGNPRSTKVNVRIIAATNRDLESAIEKGEFREDLYYRLNVFPVQVPPLRDRKEDIPLLAQHFVRKFSQKLDKPISVITKKVINELTSYPWPGNIRELENIIERAVIVSQGKKLDLGNTSLDSGKKRKKNEFCTLRELEREHILKTLRHTNWKVSGKGGAAELLGLKRTTLEARMNKLDIARP